MSNLSGVRKKAGDKRLTLEEVAEEYQREIEKLRRENAIAERVCKCVSDRVRTSYYGSSLRTDCVSECEVGIEKGKLNVKTKGKAADRMSTGLAIGAAAAGIGGGIAIAIGVYHRHQSSMRG